ncbi:MAG TPA: LemA family protein [Xanthobacteraceae bacterium]|nr:LemA family protein [Xanthobacteraceae bacterium]
MRARLAAAFAAAVLSLQLAGCGINTIPTEEERARAAWSEVLNQYQRRSDLIPNLVETVKGYAQQERDVLLQVTEARAKATQVKVDASTITNPEAFKKFQDAQAQLSGVLGRLLAIQERYPELKSNANFLALQSQLEGTENRIAVARRDYIEAVRVYNTELRTFPGVIWANTLYRNNKPMETFTITEEQMRTPKVNFNKS